MFRLIAAVLVTVPLLVGVNFSASAQSKPVAVGSILNIGDPDLTLVSSVAARGQNVWVGTTNGLYVYSVADLSAPEYLGKEATPTNPSMASINKIVLSGSVAYLAHVGLRIVDISNLSKPFTLSYIDQANNGTNGLAMDLALEDNYLYLANGADGLRIYDVSDPSNPMNIGHWPNPNGAFGSYPMGIAVRGNHVFLASYDDGVRIFDVSDRTNPVNIGYVPDAQASRLAVAGERLYVLSDVLSIYDVSSPSEPIRLSQANNTPRPTAIAVRGNFGYVAASGHTLFGPYFYDLTDSFNPVKIAPDGEDYHTGYTVWDMAVADNYAYYVVDYGIAIYWLGAPTPPPLTLTKDGENNAILTWPAPSLHFLVQENYGLDPTQWQTLVDATITTSHGKNHVTVERNKDNRFYRLISPAAP